MKRVLVALLALGVLTAAPALAAETPPVFERMKQDPADGAFWRLFDAAFPVEGARLVEQSLDADGTPRDAAEFGRRIVQLMNDNLHHMSRAPAADLLAYARTNAAYLRALQAEDPVLCGRAAMQGLSPDDVGPASADDESEAMTLAIYEGIAAGRRAPVRHGPVSAADIQALEKAMAAGGADPAVLATLTEAQPAVQCAGGVAMMEAVGRMPPEAGARFMAAIVGRLGGEPAAGMALKGEDLDRPIAEHVAELAAASEAFRLLNQEFPRSAEAAMTAMVERLRQTGDGEAAAAVMSEHVMAMVHRAAPDVARADDASLKAVALALADYYAVLQSEDPVQCGAVAMGTGQARQPFSPALAHAGEGNITAMVRALVAGRRAPVERGEVTEEDGRLLRETMLRKGVSPALVAAILDGGLDEAPPADQCAATLGMMRAAADLPDPAAGRVIALLMKVTLAAQQTR